MALYEANDRVLSEAVGYSQMTINNYRQGRRPMSVEAMDRIAAGLDLVVPPGDDEPPFEVSLFLRSPADAIDWVIQHRRREFACSSHPRPGVGLSACLIAS